MSEKDEEISDYALDKSFGEILDMINNWFNFYPIWWFYDHL